MKFSYIILTGFLLRLFYGAYVELNGVATTVEGDSLDFYALALEYHLSDRYMEFGFGVSSYINLILFFVGIFGFSEFLLCAISAIAWLMSAFIFLHILNKFSVSNSIKTLALSIFSFWPSAIYYTATPLREAFQLLFFTIIALASYEIIVRRKYKFVFLSMFGVLGAGLMHRSLLASGFIVVLVGLIIAIASTKGKLSYFTMSAYSAGAIFLLSASISFYSIIAYDMSNGLLEAVAQYNEGTLTQIARADYRLETLDTNFSSAIINLPIIFGQYLFEPFPTRSMATLDIFLSVENFLRLFIIASSMKSIVATKNEQTKVFILFLVISYFIIEFIWAVGTVNWGTASRHHVPALAYLIAPFALSGTSVAHARSRR
jgi:hypothetical protein